MLQYHGLISFIHFTSTYSKGLLLSLFFLFVYLALNFRFYLEPCAKDIRQRQTLRCFIPWV